MSAPLALLTQLTIGKMVLKNRLVLAPLTRGRSGRSQVPNAANVEYYTQRSTAGLIISEGAIISKNANGWAGAPGIYEPQHVEGWKTVTDSVHKANSLIFCQLWHMGRQASSVFHDLQPVAPSAIAGVGRVTDYDMSKHDFVVPRALETEEVAAVVQEYKHAAQSAKDAGFDGVELHGANGYLIDTFLQSSTNLRTDKYGGTKENRFQFLREIVEAVCEVFPSTQVGVKISPNGVYGTMGSADNFESFVYYAAELNKYDLAYLHVMDGLGFGFHNLCKPIKLANMRTVFDNAIIGNVGYTKWTAEGALRTGAVDLISFGRDYISNPDLPARLEHDWPLAPSNYATYYFYPDFPEGDATVGYSDYPVYSPETDGK